MTPLSFDAETAREVTGDAEARIIEAKARADADAQTFEPPAMAGETYWGQVQAQMRAVLYREQYTKRLDRNERKKTPNVRADIDEAGQPGPPGIVLSSDGLGVAVEPVTQAGKQRRNQ